MGYFFVYTTLHHKKGNLSPQCTVCLNEHLVGFFLQTRQRCSTGIWRTHPDRGNQPVIPNKSLKLYTNTTSWTGITYPSTESLGTSLPTSLLICCTTPLPIFWAHVRMT